ncbi:MAG: serine/threonine transporter SstT [Oscillospiraceae bacterium]|nr:serine/threonine transporter SstT [Oscillospiraceae bacterium]
MSIVKKWNGIPLIFRILCGLIIGAVLGLLAPGLSVISLLGKVFVGALKAVAPVLVFVLVMSALANASGNIGGRFRTVIILYMLSTFLAAVIAVLASFAFPVTMTLDVVAAENTPPGSIGEVLTNLITNMVTNPVTSLANANYIGILFWAIIFGVGLKKCASPQTRLVFQELSDVVSTAVRGIISLAPFGILGLVYDAVGESGLAIFTDYGKLLAVLVGSMLAVALIVDPLISFLFLRRNPYPLVLRCLKDSGLTAFFTRSSAANIPVNMTLCENLGLDKDFYSVSIPLGATINMDGAAITITVMTLAAAHSLGYHIDFASAILLSLLATIGACGASGVAGGSLLLIPMACSLFGISNDIAMQVVTVGFIIGVVQDSVETALNSSGDVMFAATAEYHDRAKRGEPMRFLGRDE